MVQPKKKNLSVTPRIGGENWRENYLLSPRFYLHLTMMCFLLGAEGEPGSARPSRAQRLHSSGGGKLGRG